MVSTGRPRGGIPLWVGAAVTFLVILAGLGAFFWSLLESSGEPYWATLPAAPPYRGAGTVS